MAKQFNWLYKFSFHKWYFDEVYDATVIGFTLFLSKVMSFFDSKFIDGIVNGLAWLSKWFAKFVGLFDNSIIDGFVNLVADSTGALGGVTRRLQTGKVQTYIILAIIGLTVFIYIFA